jgi:hypothetical protein
LPLVSPYGELDEVNLNSSIIIKVKNLTKIANPQAVTAE